MRHKERLEARRLRKELGLPIGVIAKQLNCSKASVHAWIRDIPLTPEQIATFTSNRQRARAISAAHPNAPKQVWQRRREQIICAAYQEVGELNLKSLRLIGAALYWAEGSKDRNTVYFTNTDPAMVRLMMLFLRKVCNVPEHKFRGMVHIHPHMDAMAALSFWSEQSNIPIKQFYKTQFAISKASQSKKADKQPMGTFRIVVNDTDTRSRIEGWIKGISE